MFQSVTMLDQIFSLSHTMEERVNLGPKSTRATSLGLWFHKRNIYLFVFKSRAQTETNLCYWVNLFFLDFAFTEGSASLDSKVYTRVVIPVHLFRAEGLIFCPYKSIEIQASGLLGSETTSLPLLCAAAAQVLWVPLVFSILFVAAT